MGIDPGLTGAVALYNPLTKTIQNIFDVPLIKPSTVKLPTANKTEKSRIDVYALANVIALYATQVALACIESPNAMPDQGVTSSFNFGKTCGMVEGIVAANCIPMFGVKPSVWKHILKLTHEKDLSLKLATKMFPDKAAMFARKKDDGRAEAALLAFFGTRFLYL